MTSRRDRELIVAEAERRLGPIDVLVNNAGGDPQREVDELLGVPTQRAARRHLVVDEIARRDG